MYCDVVVFELWEMHCIVMYYCILMLRDVLVYICTPASLGYCGIETINVTRHEKIGLMCTQNLTTILDFKLK